MPGAAPPAIRTLARVSKCRGAGRSGGLAQAVQPAPEARAVETRLHVDVRRLLLLALHAHLPGHSRRHPPHVRRAAEDQEIRSRDHGSGSFRHRDAGHLGAGLLRPDALCYRLSDLPGVAEQAFVDDDCTHLSHLHIQPDLQQSGPAGHFVPPSPDPGPSAGREGHRLPRHDKLCP